MYLAYLFVWRLVGVMPEKLAYAIGSKVSDYVYKKNGKGVKRLRSNYARVKPDLTESDLDFSAAF